MFNIGDIIAMHPTTNKKIFYAKEQLEAKYLILDIISWGSPSEEVGVIRYDLLQLDTGRKTMITQTFADQNFYLVG